MVPLNPTPPRDFDAEFDAFADRVAERAAARYRAEQEAVTVAEADSWLDAPLDEEAGPSPFAHPFVWTDPASIPLRDWLYGQHYIRQFVSATFSPGGVGKSALALAEAMAIASGKPILGIKPTQRARVAYWNGEDPSDETMRRAMAIALHHDLGRADLEGWLYLGSGRQDEITIAIQTPQGATIVQPNVERVEDQIRRDRIDVVIIDPFVSSHKATENDNNAIDTVAKMWGKIAGRTNCAVELVHHTRKTNGAETTVEDGRGATSLLYASRSARVLNVMTKDEAERAGVDKARSYFRVDSGKANLAPPPDGSTWYRMASVDLGNGTGIRPSDNVGVVSSWQWPDPFSGVGASDLYAVQKVVDGGSWRENIQAGDWVGKAVAEAMGLDLEDRAAKQKVKGLLKTWLSEGVLVRTMGRDATSRERPMIEVGRWVEL
ncbi:MAG: AAA family ATPase [Brevundimonas sp.]